MNIRRASQSCLISVCVLLSSCAKEESEINGFAAVGEPRLTHEQALEIGAAVDKCVQSGRSTESWRAPLNPTGHLAASGGTLIHKDQLLQHGRESYAVIDGAAVYLRTTVGHTQEAALYGPFFTAPSCAAEK